MPLDSAPILSSERKSLVKKLLLYFGHESFRTKQASDMMRMPVLSVGAILSDLVKKKAIYRVDPGIFSMVDPGEKPAPKPQLPKLPHHLARVLAESAKAPLPENPLVIGPITTIEQAITWLKAFKITVKREGDVFVLDERIRATAEMVIASAERRRTHDDRYPARKDRSIGRLPTGIKPPGDAQRMRNR